MKKTIAILLACIMLIGCAPIMSFAADTTYDVAGTIAADLTVNSGDKLIISSTQTLSANLTISEGATLEIAEGGYLTIAGTGRLINNGHILVKKGGAIHSNGSGAGVNGAPFYNSETGVVDLNNNSYFCIERGTVAYNKGTINNIDRMTVNGALYHFVVFPNNFTVTYRNTEMWDRVEKDVYFSIDVLSESNPDFTTDTSYLVASNYDNVNTLPETTADGKHGDWYEHKVKLYILITPEEGKGDWVDTGRMQLVINGTVFDSSERIDNDRGIFTITPVGSMNVEVLSTNYKDIVKLFEIELPSSEGYYVKAKDGEVDSVIVEYGKTFSFTVVLNEDYDKSDFYAYANGCYLTPDEYGYFDITGPIKEDYTMANAGGVQNDISITIMGVSSNASKEQANSIVNFIKEIFEVIQSIFGYFGDLFSGLFGGMTDSTVTG